MRRGTWLFAAVLLALLAAFAGKGVLIALPGAGAGSAGGFDAARAHQRLARILDGVRSHPVDSEAADLVRSRIAAEMRAVGLNPRETDDFTCHGREESRSIACGRVRNLVATMGPAQGRHLLIVAHTDSTFAGPGASDAGIGIASMLEVAALLRGRQLARPVTLLFDDGEENGLLGARAFLDSNPIAERVDSLINLEARGVSGPAIMFETSRPNAAAIAALAAVERPVANSLSTDFYRLIPNSTDVAVFERQPWTILNFAIIGDETRYHTAGDTLDAMDRRSLQHMGDQLLALTEHMAGGASTNGSGTIIYADLLGRTLVAIPQWLGLALLGLMLLMFGVTTWLRGAWGRPLLAAAATLTAAPLIAFAASYLIGWLRGGDYWRAYPLAAHLAVYASTLLAGTLAYGWIARRAERDQLRIAAWFAVLIVGAGLCALAPGAAIFFLLPPLLVALGALLAKAVAPAERVLAIVAGLVAFLTIGEALALMELLLIDGPLWLLALPAALIVLPLLVEILPGERTDRLRPVPAIAGGLVLAGWLAVALIPRASEDRQQMWTTEYVRDHASGEAWWAVSNKSVPLPDAFEAFGEWRLRELPYSGRRRWTAPAPALAIEAPRLERISESDTPAGRRVTIQVHANGAEAYLLRAPSDAALVAAGSQGVMRTLGPGRDEERYSIRCTGRSCDGRSFDILIGRREPVELSVIGIRTGLPPQATPLIEARPDHARPQYTPDSTYTIARLAI